MVARRPVVSVSGLRTELPPGDTITGGSPGTLIAGSGLDDGGGGNLGEDVEVDVSTTPSPSGLIIVDNKLGDDGVALRLAETALASGNQAIELASTALASGNASIDLAQTALASGNAALLAISNQPGGTEAEFTAASPIDVGYALGLDDNYKVQAIRSVQSINTDPITYSSSSQTVYNGDNNYQWYCYNANQDRFVSVFRRNDSTYSYAGAARVINMNSTTGDMGGGNGTTYQYANPFIDGNHVIEIPGTAKVLISYRNSASSADNLRAIIGTIASDVITFGSYTQFSGNNSSIQHVTGYDSNRSEVIFNYYRSAQYYRIGTISGTTISVGTEQSSPFTGSIDYQATAEITDLGSSNIMFTQRDTSNSNYGTCVIGTNNGTSISWGTKYVFESNSTASIGVSYDSANSQALIAYRPGGGPNADDGVAKIASISGTTITFGTLAVYAANISVSNYQSTHYDSDIQRHVITFADADSSNYPKTKCAVVTGTNITFETAATIVSDTVNLYVQSSYRQSTNQSSVIYRNGSAQTVALGSTPTLGEAIVPTVGSQNNFIGIAKTAAASGSAVTVGFPGAAQNVYTGLVAGSGYYVDPTSSGISTSSAAPASWSGGVAWQKIGRAVSSTDLYLTDAL